MSLLASRAPVGSRPLKLLRATLATTTTLATDVAFHRCHRRGFHVSVNFRFSATSCLPACLLACIHTYESVCVCVGQPLFGICSSVLCPAGGRLSMTSCIIMSPNSLRYRVASPSPAPTCRDLLRQSGFGAYESFRPNAFCHSSLDLLHDISLVEHIDMSQILPQATATTAAHFALIKLFVLFALHLVRMFSYPLSFFSIFLIFALLA